MEAAYNIPGRMAELLELAIEGGVRAGAELLKRVDPHRIELGTRAFLHDAFRACALFLDVVKLDRRRAKTGQPVIMPPEQKRLIDARMQDFSELTLALEFHNEPTLADLGKRLQQRLQARVNRPPRPAGEPAPPHEPAPPRETAPPLPTPDQGYRELAKINGIYENTIDFALMQKHQADTETAEAVKAEAMTAAPADAAREVEADSPAGPADALHQDPVLDQQAREVAAGCAAWLSNPGTGPPPEVPPALRQAVKDDPQRNGNLRFVIEMLDFVIKSTQG